MLFNHFINDLIVQLDQENKISTVGVESNCLFFADDAALHALTRDGLQRLLHICEVWARNNGIRFAPAKCVVMNENNGIACSLANEDVPQKESFKYLGVVFTHR